MLFVGIFGFFQLEMKEVNLVDDKGVPIKDRKRPLEEQETIDLYNDISYRLRGVHQGEITRLAGKVNEMVTGQLVNNKGLINNYLLALMMYREWLDEFGNRAEQIRFLGKVNRQIKIYEELEDERCKDIRKETYRVSNNIYRILTGRPQLTDEIRNLRARRFVK